MFESALRWWCRAVHKDVFHPVHGKYICGTCLREWPVPWAGPKNGPYVGLAPQVQPHANSDVVVTSPERGLLLIRLPIRCFRSTPAERPADKVLHAQAGSPSR
jgi:hypothetical protein